MRLRTDTFTLFALLAVLGLASGCTSVEVLNQPALPSEEEPPVIEDDPVVEDDPVDEALPLNIDGAWDTYATELADSCGFDPPEPYAPMWVEESTDGVTVTVDDGTGTCQESIRTRNGDTVTLVRSDVLDLNGAFVRVDVNIVYEFTADGFSGTATQSFTDLSGVFTDLPCEVTLSVSGTRCDDCWTGCSSIQGASGDPRIPLFESRLNHLSVP